MNTIFVFRCTCLDLITNIASTYQKRIVSASPLGAQVQLLLHLNKRNKEGNGKAQFWCDELKPEETLVCDS